MSDPGQSPDAQERIAMLRNARAQMQRLRPCQLTTVDTVSKASALTAGARQRRKKLAATCRRAVKPGEPRSLRSSRHDESPGPAREPDERRKQHRGEPSDRQESAAGERRKDAGQHEHAVGKADAPADRPQRGGREQRTEQVQHVVARRPDVAAEAGVRDELVVMGRQRPEALIGASPRGVGLGEDQRVPGQVPEEQRVEQEPGAGAAAPRTPSSWTRPAHAASKASRPGEAAPAARR